MSAFTPTSGVLLRHNDDFGRDRILFAGGLQGDLPTRLSTAANRAHTQQFHRWQVLSHRMGDNARFSLIAAADDVANCDTLIYYWPKNKPEAQFQLMNLLSLLLAGTNISVVSGSRSSVRSARRMLADYAPLNKVDNARRCGLYFGRLEKQPVFDANKFWDGYSVDGLTVKMLPGVFSHDGLNVGSQLLLSTLTPHAKDKVLDVGRSAGVLSVAFARHSPEIRPTLYDISISAIEASHATLAANGVKGEVFTSNVFSEVKGRFGMIISNPPFHSGIQTSLDTTQTLTRGTVRHPSSGGELQIVTSVSLPYPDVLDETFGFHEVIAQTGRFKIYHTIMTHQAKKS